MIPKVNRAETKLVEQIFKQGKVLSSPSFTFRFIFEGKTGRKISVIAPKAVSKSAVERNLLRRSGYFALEGLIGSFPLGVRGAIVLKKKVTDISILQNEIKTTLNKLH